MSSEAILAAGPGHGQERGGDRLSRLGDGALGHILSFLPASEAARAAVLSRRWRHVFAAMHTLSFDETEGPFLGYDWNPCSYCHPAVPDVVPAPRFATGVSAALLGRDQGASAAGAPLRALRVAFDEFLGGDSATAVDGWLSYAAYHAGDELNVDLCLDRKPVCARAYALRRRGPDAADDDDGDQEQEPIPHATVDTEPNHEDEDEDPSSPKITPIDEEEKHPWWPTAATTVAARPGQHEYVVPRSLFSCAVLRALRLGSCRLDPPAAIALPSLDTLHLTRVTGRRGAVQRLVSACPRLADLMLEACWRLTALSVLGVRLRRLALQCCHELATVAVDSSELRVLKYHGAVPEPSFLTMHGHGSRQMSLCTLDFRGEELAGPLELARLGVGGEQRGLYSLDTLAYYHIT